jgi:hypothetical protein
MKKFKLTIDNFSISYDSEYGIDHKFGWSVVEYKRIIFEFEPTLFKAIKKYLKYKKEIKKNPYRCSKCGHQLAFVNCACINKDCETYFCGFKKGKL